jgi:hypothetical protein
MPMSKKKENEILYEIAIEGNIMKWFQKFMKQYGENACESLMDSFFKEHDAEIRADEERYKKKYGIKSA